MNAIFTSKLYQGSSIERKRKIQSAIQDPVNSELVQQLRRYLDDKYISEEYLDPDPDDFETHDTDERTNEATPSRQSPLNEPAPPRPTAPAHFSPIDRVDETDLQEADEEDTEDMVDSIEPPRQTEDDEGTLSEATKLPRSTKVVSCIDISSISAEIKGSLNARSDTAGVSRVQIRDKELWIYYNDSISLNNVMDSVIDILFRLGYTYLQFDRLARSDNAVVFMIDGLSSIEGVISDDKQQ